MGTTGVDATLTNNFMYRSNPLLPVPRARLMGEPQTVTKKRFRRAFAARRPPTLYISQILAWADAYHARHGTWPTGRSGPIAGSRGETWTGVDVALYVGRRGFPGGSSLARLLAKQRGFRHPKYPPPLSVEQILQWARTYRRRTGRWPTARSGIILEARGETWQMVDGALRDARRGINRRTPLFRLLSKPQNAHC